MISRRQALTGGLAIVAGSLGPPGLRPTLAKPALSPTPAQPAGPFYPPAMPAEYDPDLVKVAGAYQALGQVVHLDGTVRTVDGAAVPKAWVEIWQCDANGVYHHAGDEREKAEDHGFQGYGATLTNAFGVCRFRTIHPVPYPGRTPHIHVMVSAPGMRRLTTQLYVAGLESNARDFLFSRLDPEEQARLLVEFKPAPEPQAGALVGRFDLVVERD